MRPFDAIRRRTDRLSARTRAIGMFFATSLAARLVGISCQLLQVPVALRALGPEAFGLWMTLTSIGTMILLVDFGMGQGAQNRLAEAFAAGAEARARELLGSVAAFLVVVSLAVLAGIALTIPHLDFTRLFNLVDPGVQRQASPAITVALLLFGANIPLGLAQRLAYSRQRGWQLNVAQGLASAAALGGVLLAARARAPLATFILAAQLPVLVGNAGLLACQLVQLGWLDLRRLRGRWAVVRELLGLGACFGIQQVQLILLLSLPPVIISTALGAAAVTPYNLVQRLFNLFAIVQNAFMLPLWPAYSDAKARGEFGWIRRTLVRSLGATLLITITPMAAGAWLARPLLGLWVGHRVPFPSATLVWLLFAWNALVFLQQNLGYLLAGLSEVRRLTFYAVVSTAIIAVLMSLLVRRYGRDGVVLGMILGFMPYLVLGNVGETVRVFRAIKTGPPTAAPLPATP
jgi:O-antigen/teichoic acid export membrane protein